MSINIDPSVVTGARLRYIKDVVSQPNRSQIDDCYVHFEINKEPREYNLKFTGKVLDSVKETEPPLHKDDGSEGAVKVYLQDFFAGKRAL